MCELDLVGLHILLFQVSRREEGGPVPWGRVGVSVLSVACPTPEVPF